MLSGSAAFEHKQRTPNRPFIVTRSDGYRLPDTGPGNHDRAWWEGVRLRAREDLGVVQSRRGS
jgi:hypothetical protein